VQLLSIKIYGSLENATNSTIAKVKRKEYDELDKKIRLISNRLKKCGINFKSILEGAASLEIKRLSERLIVDPSNEELIFKIIEKMKLFRESEATYNLGFVLDMTYITHPLVVDYIQNGGNKNFMEVVELIRERQRRDELIDRIKKEGIDISPFSIDSFTVTVQYLTEDIEIDELLPLLTKAIEFRKQKQERMLKAASESEIDLKDEKIAQDVEDFLVDDKNEDMDHFIYMLQKKTKPARTRKPTIKLLEANNNLSKRTKVEEEETKPSKKQKTEKTSDPAPLSKRRGNKVSEDKAEEQEQSTKKRRTKSKRF